MKRYLAGIIFTLIFLMHTSTKSLAVTYDFDAPMPGTMNEVNFSSGFSGVSFDNTIGYMFSWWSTSPWDDLTGAISNSPSTPNGSTIATLDTVTDFVGVRMGLWQNDSPLFTLQLYAYDTSDQLIGFDTADLSGCGTTCQATLSVSSPDIAWVEFYASITSDPKFAPFWDNFTFNENFTPVPEPSTMLLLGSGLVGLGLVRRKFKS